MNNYHKGIIAVSGKSCCGKTTTLRKLAALLKTYPKKNIIYESTPKLKGDLRLVIEINDAVIAVETQGDPGTDLEKRLQTIVTKWKPNLIFCSTRTSGDTVRAVEELAKKHNFERVWTSTYQANRDQDSVNELKAKHLVELANYMSFMS